MTRALLRHTPTVAFWSFVAFALYMLVIAHPDGMAMDAGQVAAVAVLTAGLMLTVSCVLRIRASVRRW